MPGTSWARRRWCSTFTKMGANTATFSAEISGGVTTTSCVIHNRSSRWTICKWRVPTAGASTPAPPTLTSAWGMAEAWRIRHHLANNIGNPANLILFIGYCAEHTLGAQILAGHNPVNIFGEPHQVRARVASLDSFSGHADKNELRRYVESIGGDIKKISVIHGEESQALAFAETLRVMKPKAGVFVPAYRDTIEI